MTQAREAGWSEADPFDVVAIGETMVAFVADDDTRRYLAVAAGAESNVAIGMAQLGCRARWVSRLGDDPLGRFVEDSVADHGVDVATVRDGSRPTGVMTKHVTNARTLVQYYRSESAARALSVEDLRRAGRARLMHVTGITPALSASAAHLVEAIVEHRIGHDGRVAFDVNHRPALWAATATASAVVLPLARRADIVFMGHDEAEALFGTSEAASLAALILRRDGQEIVLKRGAGPASVVTRDGEISAPALQSKVVDVTGAGDAFAAGYLAAVTFGWPMRARLQLGHLMGSRVVRVLEDVPPPFTPVELGELSPVSLSSRWAGAPITDEEAPA